MRALVPTVILLALSVGCAGKKKLDEDPNWQSKDAITTQDDASAFLEVGAPTQIADPRYDWVGVRPDLAIASTHPRKSTCDCLTVEVGQPTDDKFTWEGAIPRISGNKLAVAVSAFGIHCQGGPTDQAERRPSIRAVERRGRDVVIEIEDIPVDRPVASGAIINPPDHGGAIWVRPRSRAVPYARPHHGEWCRAL
jgi:hypothetical protein